jgi:hypothetical protein
MASDKKPNASKLQLLEKNEFEAMLPLGAKIGNDVYRDGKKQMLRFNYESGKSSVSLSCLENGTLQTISNEPLLSKNVIPKAGNEFFSEERELRTILFNAFYDAHLNVNESEAAAKSAYDVMRKTVTAVNPDTEGRNQLQSSITYEFKNVMPMDQVCSSTFVKKLYERNARGKAK